MPRGRDARVPRVPAQARLREHIQKEPEEKVASSNLDPFLAGLPPHVPKPPSERQVRGRETAGLRVITETFSKAYGLSVTDSPGGFTIAVVGEAQPLEVAILPKREPPPPPPDEMIKPLLEALRASFDRADDAGRGAAAAAGRRVATPPRPRRG